MGIINYKIEGLVMSSKWLSKTFSFMSYKMAYIYHTFLMHVLMLKNLVVGFTSYWYGVGPRPKTNPSDIHTE